MRILFILPQPPDPPDSGGKIVLHHLVRYFRDRHQVTLACLWHHPRDCNTIRQTEKLYEKVLAFPARPKWSLPVVGGALLSAKPYKAQRFWNPELDRAIRRILIQEEFDLIHVQNFYMGQYITGNEKALKVLYKENVESNIWYRFAETRSNPIMRKFAELEAKKLDRFERYICTRFDRVLMISPSDLEQFHKLAPSLNLDYQPPGLDLKSYPFISEESPNSDTLLFTGSLSYFPNQDGIKWFLNEIYPKVHQKLPNIKIKLVGKDPPEWLKNLKNYPGVEVTGWVEDIKPYFKNALGYIVPLRIGGGVRLKILEAWAMGVPVISTPVGAEGLPVKDGENILLASDPDKFVEKIERLIQMPQDINNLKVTARKLVEKHFDEDQDFPSSGQKISDIDKRR